MSKNVMSYSFAKRIIIFTILIVCVFVACRREFGNENSIDRGYEKITKAKSWFEKYITTFQPDPMFSNINYRWDKAKVTKAPNGNESIVVPIYVNSIVPGYLGMRSLILYPWKNGQGYYTNVLETIFDADYYGKSRGRFELSKFKGLMNIWSLKTGFSRGAYFTPGEMPGIVDLLVVLKQDSYSSRIAPLLPCTGCLPGVTVYSSYNSANSNYTYNIQIMINGIFTSSYLYEGGTIGPNPIEYSGSGETQDITDQLDINFWNDYWASYWESIQQDYFNTWNTSFLKDSTGNPCVGSALSTLKSIVKSLPASISDFFGEFPSFNQTFKMGFQDSSLTAGGLIQFPNPAWTSGVIAPGNIKFTTYINSFYNHMTDLGQAANIIHEALHCMFISKYNLASGDTAKTRQLASEYGFIYSGIYRNTILEMIATETTPQHDLTTTLYQNVFATALYQYGVTKGILTATPASLDYCRDLAFWGADDSQAFINLPIADKNRIYDRIAAEQDPSGVLGLANLPSVPAIGTPCP